MDAKKSFSPSVNIIRDNNRELEYIVTKNAAQIANQLISDFNNNCHCFNIIGSYGTGKSTFLWALERNFKNQNEFFFHLNGHFNNFIQFEIVNIVGSYSPFDEVLIEALQPKRGKRSTSLNALSILSQYYKRCQKSKKFLIIAIDEFGKILEYAARNTPEKSVYLLQQIAEFINDPENNILLINTLHQNFNAYSVGLTTEQRQEWNKVRGRFIELPFNEPIEHLLFIAAEQIKRLGFGNLDSMYNQSLNDIIIKSGLLPISNDSARGLSSQILPLDVLSASVLTVSFQDYGQNERSVFTFLSRKGKDSLYEYAKYRKRFDLIAVYEFLVSNFYSHIFDKYNRDKNKWDRIRISLDRVSYHFIDDLQIAESLVKVIGILSIYGHKGGMLNEDFLVNYIGKSEVRTILSRLSELKIIIFRKHLSSYSLTEGTDLDFYQAIEDASTKIDAHISIPWYLNKYYALPFLNAKRISYEKGTPRYFEFRLTDELKNDLAQGEIDGYIYLIFNQDLHNNDLQKFSSSANNANVYVLYNNTRNIKKIIFELLKVEYVLNDIKNDKVAEEELIKIKEALRTQLNNEVLDNIYFHPDKTTWFYDGSKQEIVSEKAVNELLSRVCENTYKLTPEIRNELINKHNISSAISTARKSYIKALLNNSDQKNLGFDEHKYPPEKTIYQSLLISTGIHSKLADDTFGFNPPSCTHSIYHLWNECEQFFKNAISEEKSIQELIEKLRNKPFKLKDGLISFWLPTLLIIKRDEYALFKERNYLPFLSEELFDIMLRKPEIFTIKTYPFGGLEVKVFNKYRELFDIEGNKEITNQNIIETIKPFLLFYKQLPSYALKTEKISPQAKEFRNAIANASDPYSAFFNDFPNARGYRDFNSIKNENALEAYINSLKKVINELSNAYTELIERVELNLVKLTGALDEKGLELKEVLQNRFELINIDRLSGVHKKLLSRFRLPYENRALWFEALAMAIIEKPLKSFSDIDEEIFYTSFEKLYQDLIDIIPIYEHAHNEKTDVNKIIGLKVISSNGVEHRLQAIVNKRSEEMAHIYFEKLNFDLRSMSPADKRAFILELVSTILDE